VLNLANTQLLLVVHTVPPFGKSDFFNLRTNIDMVSRCFLLYFTTCLMPSLSHCLSSWNRRAGRETHEAAGCIHCKVKPSLFRLNNALHHCRNCGYLVCGKASCSDKEWLDHMIPETYHSDKKYIRICRTCALVNKWFVSALLSGSYEEAMRAYGTGNVNVHSPLYYGSFPVSLQHKLY
jgi:hypothetical protein